MKEKKEYKYLENYFNWVQSEGKLYFTLTELKNEFSEYSLNSIQMNLKRINKQQKIKHIMKGFYVIIPPEYSYQKMLPPELFIDALFKFLGRKYYVGLLSAAIYHGASHQQPQEYFVMIEKPAIRSTKVESLKINYIVNSDLKKSKVEDKKTRTGYMKVSKPEQTILDLIRFQNRIGGLNRAVTVIYELVEEMNETELGKVILDEEVNAVLQRLGYLLEVVLQREDLSNVISEYLRHKRIFRVPLKPSINKKGFLVNTKWKIIENHKIGIDF